MSDIALLRTFLAVVRNGTFTGAARDLHLSQPAVSLQVRALEGQLGKPLFRREARGATPTPAGFELAQSVAAHIDALEGVMGDGTTGDGVAVADSVHVGGPEEFMAIRVLPELMPLVLGGLRLRMYFDVDRPIIERLQAGELDIAITTDAWRRRGLDTERLCFEELVLVGAPPWAERLAHLQPGPAGAKLLADLDVPIAAYDEELPIVREYWPQVFETPAQLRATVVANSLRATLQFAIRGAGITVLPEHVVATAIESGELVRLLDPAEPPRNQLHLAWRAGTLRRRSLARVHERISAAARGW